MACRIRSGCFRDLGIRKSTPWSNRKQNGFRNEHGRHPRLKVIFSSLPTYAFALSRFVCGLPLISSRDPYVWHHASRLSRTHQSDVLFSLAQSLASDAFCEVPFQISLRSPHFLLALTRDAGLAREMLTRGHGQSNYGSTMSGGVALIEKQKAQQTKRMSGHPD